MSSKVPGNSVPAERFDTAVGWMIEAVDGIPTGGSVLRDMRRRYDEMYLEAMNAAKNLEERAELTTARSELGVVVVHFDVIGDHISRLRARLSRIAGHNPALRIPPGPTDSPARLGRRTNAPVYVTSAPMN